MKTIQPLFFAIGILLLPQLSYSQEANLPETPEQYFHFWLGTWKASWDEGNGVKALGRNRITLVMDSSVVQEEFSITKGKSKGFKGRSLSVYRPNQKQWKQAWADNQGGYFDFTGYFEGDKRIFQTTADSTGLIQRMVFYHIQHDKFTWDWESSRDGGKSWKLNWRIFYEREEE